MGDRLAALFAGAAPKINPTAVDTPKARITASRVTLAGKAL